MNFNFGTPNTAAVANTGTPASTAGNLAGGDNKGLSTPQTGAKTQSFGLNFGATPIASTANTGFSLNTPASSFGATNPAQNKSFGTAALTAPAISGTSTSALTGFSLGAGLLAQTATPSLLTTSLATTTAPSLSSSGPATATSAPSFNLGSTLGAPATTSTGFTLGGSSAGLTLGTPASSSFTLGKGIAPPATQISSGLSLTSTTIASTTLPTSTSATTPAPAGSFTFGQLEEALNKWTLELEDQGKMFINQALQLNAWDRLVIANGEKILTLNNGIEKVKQQQLQLDHELDFVLAQQRELEECIVPLEKELKDIPVTDQDRNHTYQIAENMDTQLKQMSEDLKEVIEHLNESNKTEETNDPVTQIGRILNAHMNSLQWIDRNTAQISTYLDQISKMHDMHRRDNERSFHLTYE